ncbi:MAG: hypothetical protein HKM00_06445 [Gallionella sp.]|jgi:hypothetical protein|nr:hypothetical protein [Gallionella sp.]
MGGEKYHHCCIVPLTKVNIKVELADKFAGKQMARYKYIDTSPRLIVVVLQEQLSATAEKHKGAMFANSIYSSYLEL